MALNFEPAPLLRAGSKYTVLAQLPDLKGADLGSRGDRCASSLPLISQGQGKETGHGGSGLRLGWALAAGGQVDIGM